MDTQFLDKEVVHSPGTSVLVVLALFVLAVLVLIALEPLLLVLAAVAVLVAVVCNLDKSDNNCSSNKKVELVHIRFLGIPVCDDDNCSVYDDDKSNRLSNNNRLHRLKHFP